MKDKLRKLAEDYTVSTEAGQALYNELCVLFNVVGSIRLEVYQEILDDCKAMYSEYILDHIREQISILKYGI